MCAYLDHDVNLLLLFLQEIVIAIGLVNRRQLEVRVGLIENGVLVIALNSQARSERKIALRKWHSYLLEIKQTDT